jgi:hypothetical protein
MRHSPTPRLTESTPDSTSDRVRAVPRFAHSGATPGLLAGSVGEVERPIVSEILHSKIEALGGVTFLPMLTRRWFKKNAGARPERPGRSPVVVPAEGQSSPGGAVFQNAANRAVITPEVEAVSPTPAAPDQFSPDVQTLCAL